LSEHLTPTQIEDYGRHKLTAAELFSVSNHLDVCEACSRQVERALDGDAAFFALKSEAFGDEGMLFSPAVRTHMTPEQMSGYIDELLAGEELQTVTDHLTGCEQCEMAVNDLRAFRSQIAAGLYREYQPSSVVRENPWRRVLAYMPPLLPKPRTLIFGSALASLLLILAGWSILQMLQREETAVVETPHSPPTSAVTPVVSPPPSPGEAGATLVAQLNDGRGQVTLDQEGNLSGIDNLSPAYLKMIRGALTNQQLEKSQLLAGLTRLEDSPVRGRDDQDGKFSTIKPVGTVILSDRPTFRWSRLDGAASYVVEVYYDDDFTQATASSQLIDNSWTAPKSLPRGRIYTWQVKAIKDDGQTFISPPPDQPVAKFRILDQARAKKLDQARRTYAGSHLVLGVLYTLDGLLDDAELELRALQKANPGSAIAHRLLANVRVMRR
jgi:anti-sigma factor RsiW